MTITKSAKVSASHILDLPVNEFGFYQAHFVYIIRYFKNQENISHKINYSKFAIISRKGVIVLTIDV